MLRLLCFVLLQTLTINSQGPFGNGPRVKSPNQIASPI